MEYGHAMDAYTVAHERVQNSLVARTFIWLAAGLVLSGSVAAYVGLNDTLYKNSVDNRVLFWIVILGPLAIIVALGRAMDRPSVASAGLLYLLFSFTEGLMLSVIFQAHSTSSVAQVFFIAAAMFGVVGTIGFVTDRDLSKLGGILFLFLLRIFGRQR